MANTRFLQAVAVAWIAIGATADSYFFNNTDFVNQVAPISKACATALQADIACDPYLRYVMTSDYYGPVGNDTFQDMFCSSTCGKGLQSYRSTVAGACKNDPQPRPGYPATYWADSATSAWTTLCQKDSKTGKYCTDFITSLSTNQNSDEDGTELPESDLCAPCIVSLFRHMQSTSFSNYDSNLASVWSKIQKTCGLSFPTDVPKLVTNVTTPGGFAPPGAALSTCLSGVHYSVVSGDSCQAIAEKHDVATGTLMVINSLYLDCSNLQAGASICIPPTCSTYKVKSGDTCDSIGKLTNTNFQQIAAWNPVVDAYCSNLMADQSICVSPPGGAKNLKVIAGATATQTAPYATETAAVPDPVGVGTTQYCGKYYKVEPGAYCQLIALNQTIDLSLFLALNPSINSDCTNLEAGVSYCVLPTQDWTKSSTTTSAAISSTVPAPTNVAPGSIADCYEYYTVKSGDYCAKIDGMFGITFAQLRSWNSGLDADCSNLALGEAYCVRGTSQSPSRVRREVVATQEGGVPYGWPGLLAPRNQMKASMAI